MRDRDVGFTIRLPFPNSVNHMYHRSRRGGLHMSEHGRKYREAAVALLRLARVKPVEGRAEVLIALHPPPGRRLDIDNGLKALLDSLQAGGAFADDSQVWSLSVTRREERPGGEAIVTVRPYVPEESCPKT